MYEEDGFWERAVGMAQRWKLMKSAGRCTEQISSNINPSSMPLQPVGRAQPEGVLGSRRLRPMTRNSSISQG